MAKRKLPFEMPALQPHVDKWHVVSAVRKYFWHLPKILRGAGEYEIFEKAAWPMGLSEADRRLVLDRVFNPAFGYAYALALSNVMAAANCDASKCLRVKSAPGAPRARSKTP